VKGLPIRRAQFDVQGFAASLASNGAEVGVPTNPYEVIRYRAYRANGPHALRMVAEMEREGRI
jgi:hypothetical protein